MRLRMTKSMSIRMSTLLVILSLISIYQATTSRALAASIYSDSVNEHNLRILMFIRMLINLIVIIIKPSVYSQPPSPPLFTPTLLTSIRRGKLGGAAEEA